MKYLKSYTQHFEVFKIFRKKNPIPENKYNIGDYVLLNKEKMSINNDIDNKNRDSSRMDRTNWHKNQSYKKLVPKFRVLKKNSVNPFKEEYHTSILPEDYYAKIVYHYKKGNVVFPPHFCNNENYPYEVVIYNDDALTVNEDEIVRHLTPEEINDFKIKKDQSIYNL